MHTIPTEYRLAALLRYSAPPSVKCCTAARLVSLLASAWRKSRLINRGPADVYWPCLVRHNNRRIMDAAPPTKERMA